MAQGINGAKTIVNCTKEQVNELSDLLNVRQKEGWSLERAMLFENDVISLVFNIKGVLFRAIIPPERNIKPTISLISTPIVKAAGQTLGDSSGRILGIG